MNEYNFEIYNQSVIKSGVLTIILVKWKLDYGAHLEDAIKQNQ